MKKILSAFLVLAMAFAILPAGTFSTPAKAATSGDYADAVCGDESAVTDSNSQNVADQGATQSVSVSSSIKVYSVKNRPGLGCFHFNLNYCEAYGSDTESKFKEFTEIVNEGYFNTYLLPVNADLIRAAKIIAQSGGTIWLAAGLFSSESSTIEAWGENQKVYLDLLKKEGVYDIVNGYYFDEPIWRGQTNADFLTQTEYIYKNLGLRNFPVFACGEFSGLEGSAIGTPDQMRKLTTESCKYVTDAAFDSYSVDVRDGAPNANKYEQWTEAVGGKPITDGKSYYIQYKNHLKEHINHPVNYWYYATAYKTALWGGLNGLKYADEDYCIAHVEFMAEDILKEKYAGGVILYTYSNAHGENTGFASYCDVKDKNGNFALYPDAAKWTRYCTALRQITKKFNVIDSTTPCFENADGPSEHEFVKTVTEPTCVEQGFSTYTCKNCQKSYTTDYTETTYHDYVAEVTEPTCANKGYTIYTCKNCDDSYKGDITPINKNNHVYSKKVTEPTCTTVGFTSFTCVDCGYSCIGDYTPIKHSYSETVVTPTETADGYTQYTCIKCSHSYKDNFVSFKDVVSGVKISASDVDVTLFWNALEDASEYYAKVYDKDFTTCIKTITTKETSAVFDYSVLDYNTDYQFIVTAKLSSGKYLTVADAMRLKGKMVIADRVVGHSVEMEGVGAVVSFLPVENATEYLVNVFEDDAQGNRIHTATLSKDATSARIMNNLTAGKKYVVMINAKVNGKYMPLSDLRVNGIGISFVAPVVNPSSVTVAAETATSIRFNWDAVRGATEYYVRVKEKETGVLVNTLKAVGKTTATLARHTDGRRISPNTTYTLEICAYVPGVAATYGEAIEITTIDYEDVTVTARYNKNYNKINLSWNQTTNAVGYFVYTYKDGLKIANKYLDGADNTIYEFTAPAASGAYTYGVVVYEKNSSGTAYTPVSVSNEVVR